MLSVLYQDTHFVAINKPAGMLVHRSKIDPREKSIALQQVRDQLGIRVFPIHRLDKPTSGVLLFALNKEAARLLASSFATREVTKSYLAVVRGYLPPDGVVDYPLKEVHDKKTDSKARSAKPAQAATTAYETLDTVELPFPVGRYNTARYTFARLSPQTGRKHQLRRHMKHIFHPVAGDRKYGDWRHNKFLAQQFDCHHLLLHASTLAFTHPFTTSRVVIQAGLPAYFSGFLQAADFKLRDAAIT